MNNNTEGNQILERLLKEHNELMVSIRTIRQWIDDITEWGMPRFGELGMQLEPFRDALGSHFAGEESVDVSGAPGAAGSHNGLGHAEIAELHDSILKRLDILIHCLRATEPPFCSWQAAVREAEELMTEIHEHEHGEMLLLQAALADPGSGSDNSE